MDGGTSPTSTTIVNADRVVLNDDGTMKQVAVTDLDTYISSTTKTLTNKTWNGNVLEKSYLPTDTVFNTNKFTVIAGTGNTTISGTLNVTGLSTLTGGFHMKADSIIDDNKYIWFNAPYTPENNQNTWFINTDTSTPKHMRICGTDANHHIVLQDHEGRGNVGIRTTNPITKLQIGSDDSTHEVGWNKSSILSPVDPKALSIIYEGETTNNNTVPLIELSRWGKANHYYGSRAQIKLGRYSSTNFKGVSQLDFSLLDGDYHSLLNTIMSLQANGNVGIGESNPSEKLHVYGDTKLEGATNVTGVLTATGGINGGTGKGVFLNTLGTFAGTGAANSANYHVLWFNTGAHQDYNPGPTVTSGLSNSLFNTIGTGTNTPSGKYGYFLKLHENGTILYLNSPYGYTGSYGSEILLTFRNVAKFRFRSTGEFQYVGGQINPSVSDYFTPYSDDRLKINEEELPLVTPLLKKLKPQKYKKRTIDRLYTLDNPTPFMERLSENTIEEFGLIAQEVYTIPEFRLLVVPSSDSDMDKIKTTVICSDLVEPDNYYENYGWGTQNPSSVNYTGFIPILIKGFQEQQEEITIQKQKINELTLIIDKLKNASSFEDFKSQL